MLKNILMTLPAIALALPIAAATPSASAGEPRWGGQQQVGPDYDDEGYASVEIGLELCVMAQVLAEDRACALVDADKGLARCEVRGGGFTPFQEDDYDEPEGLIFVEIASCTTLGVNITVEN